MSDTAASINSKGLEGTGITEDMAAELFHKVGTHLMAVVDLQVVDKHGPNLKGKRKVVFSIDNIEPVTDDNVAEHLREISRTLFYNRQVDQPIPGTGDDITPDLKTVLAGGRRYEAHPFLPVEAADDNGICDVCGEVQDRPQHADRTALQDPFAVTEVDLDEAEEDEEYDPDEDGDDLVETSEYDEPHTFDAGPDDSCICGAPYGNPIHLDVPAEQLEEEPAPA